MRFAGGGEAEMQMHRTSELERWGAGQPDKANEPGTAAGLRSAVRLVPCDGALRRGPYSSERRCRR